MYPLTSTAEKLSDSLALQSMSEQLTFSTLNHKVKCVANALQELLDSTGGNRIAVFAANSKECIFAAHAVWASGNTLIPLPLNWRDEQLQREIDAARLDLLLVDAANNHRVNHPNKVPVTQLVEENSAHNTLLDFSPAKLALLLYTSGSSGEPKRVALSWNALVSHAQISVEHLQLLAEDRWLLTLPLFHIGGISTLFKQMSCGCSIVLPELEQLRDATAITSFIEQAGVTRAAMVPTSLERLYQAMPNYRFPDKFRSMLAGGGMATEELLLRDHRILATYGMSETGSQITTVPLHATTEIRSTAGIPLPGVRIEIRDESHTPLPINEVGDVWVASPALFDGYETVTGIVSPMQNGWFQTGDFGYLNPDDALTIVSRRSDRIVSGGENIAPHEIELCLLKHPEVTSVVVLGVPDQEWGELVVAVVVPKHSDRVDSVMLVDYLGRQLARYKLPKRWLLLPELPLLPTGKPDRQAIRALLSLNVNENGTLEQ
ncbi:MAG: AMP-binding protein [bacterium]|nr:AMP-binding protein [bacterium]